jgi:hypothetical protein
LEPSDLRDWLNEEAYRTKVQPLLAGIMVPAIATALGISKRYATDVRAARRVPHPRHWVTLAKLVGILEKQIDHDFENTAIGS